MQQTVDEQEKWQLEAVLNSGISIPPQPSILLEIEKQVAKPGNSLVAISNLIAKDVGLSASVFKLVNSPFYKRRSPVESITKAITVLGLSQLTNIIKGMALRKALSGQEPAYENFWERSNEIANLSAIIAGKQISACNIAVDQAYMAGLFHGCGVPVLMQRFPEYCKAFRLNQGTNWPSFHEEDQRFNTDHTVVGYLVAKHWNLPDFICQAIRFHHDNLHIGHATLTLVSILQMARHLYASLHDLPDAEWPEIQEKICEEIGLHLDGLQEFSEEVLDIHRQN
ncbi:MAG: HDOD domain-containing protein [Burkholderiales bacterium]